MSGVAPPAEGVAAAIAARDRTRGLLIALEGPQGSGKTTQQRLLQTWLESEGHDVVTSRWPSSRLVKPLIKARKRLRVFVGGRVLAAARRGLPPPAGDAHPAGALVGQDRDCGSLPLHRARAGCGAGAGSRLAAPCVRAARLARRRGLLRARPAGLQPARGRDARAALLRIGAGRHGAGRPLDELPAVHRPRDHGVREARTGEIGYRADNFGFNSESRTNWNTSIVEVNLNGPGPLTTYVLPALGAEIPGEVGFFGTAYANLSDGYTRWVDVIGPAHQPVGYERKAPTDLFSSLIGTSRWSPRRSNNYSWLTKFTYKPSGTMKLSYTWSQSTVIDQNTQAVQVTLERVEPNPGYQYLFQYIPDSANTFTQRNIQHVLGWTHTLSPQTFYELRLSRYTAHVRGDANGKPFDQYLEPQDIVTYPVVYYNRATDTVGVFPGDVVPEV